MKCKICKKTTCSCNYSSNPRLSSHPNSKYFVTMDSYDKIIQKHSFDSRKETFSITTERKSKVKIHQREIPSTQQRRDFLPFDEYVKRKENFVECSTCLKRTSGGCHEPPDEGIQQVSREFFCWHFWIEVGHFFWRFLLMTKKKLFQFFLKFLLFTKKIFKTQFFNFYFSLFN